MNTDTVTPDGALVSRRAFSDEELHARELERVFRRSWLFLCADDMIPANGDYVTTYMGEDAVVAVRGEDGVVRAFLNTCPHRGNKVCMYDSGHAKGFTCSFHGWSFNTKGALTGVPFAEDAYNGSLDRAANGLVEVPRVETFHGLVFGSWNANAPPIETYLGEFAWYLSTFYLAAGLGGLQFVRGTQRYRLPGNWKLMSENFAGDHYHTYTTHASGFKIGQVGTLPLEDNVNGYFEIALEPFHGLGGVYTNTMQYERDLAQAKTLGSEVVDYVTERYAKLQAILKDHPAKPYGFTHATCFPNLSFFWGSSVFAPRGLYMWHPKGPLATEAWQWCFVERDAPQVVKERAVLRFSRIQSAAGVLSADDGENFDRIVPNTTSPATRDMTFNYSMGLGVDDRRSELEHWNDEGLPGTVGPRFTEMNQRLFYRRWHELMETTG